MPSPFPGMDPYLEDPVGWTDVHQRLITTLSTELNRLLPLCGPIQPQHLPGRHDLETFFPNFDRSPGRRWDRCAGGKRSAVDIDGSAGRGA